MSINLFIEYIPFLIHFNWYTFVLTIIYLYLLQYILSDPEKMNFNIYTEILYKLSKNS